MNPLLTRFVAAVALMVVAMLWAHFVYGMLFLTAGVGVLGFLIGDEVTDQLLSLRGGE